MGRDVWSGQLHCRMSYPCPISCPLASNTVHQSVHLQWSVQSTFALPPPPPRLLSLARPDPGYILTRHGLTLAMSRTGQDRGRLQDFRSTIQIFQVSKKAHYRKMHAFILRILSMFTLLYVKALVPVRFFNAQKP